VEGVRVPQRHQAGQEPRQRRRRDWRRAQPAEHRWRGGSVGHGARVYQRGAVADRDRDPDPDPDPDRDPEPNRSS